MLGGQQLGLALSLGVEEEGEKDSTVQCEVHPAQG